MLNRVAGKWRRSRDLRCIRSSELFDGRWYGETYPDVLASGSDPALHYLVHGWKEGRNPSSRFDGASYLAAHPDVAAAGICPLVHFLRHGRREGRRGEAVVADQRLVQPPPASLDGSEAPIIVPDHPEPLVSILIPVYNQWHFTYACVRSLRDHVTGVSYEVILADDGSSDATRDAARLLPGARVVRDGTNRGFLLNCNHAAQQARGRFLLLLNNDTHVHQGAVETLVRTLQEDPGIGLVGAQLLFPDGTLQEAGGIVYEDGSGCNHGRGKAPDRSEFAFLRDADYCSGAAIMLPLDLWRSLGGFDPRFAPAYYEDTDLAFRVRAAGRRVVYQPFAKVTHFEGVSNGKDLATGVKRHQVVNREVFRARWAETMRGWRPGDPPRGLPHHRPLGGRVLVIDEQTPTPDRDSGSIDTVGYLRGLLRLGFHVTYAPVCGFRHAGAYTEALQRMGVECLHAPGHRSLDPFLEEHGRHLDLVLAFRYTTLIGRLERLRRLAPRARILLETVDLHFLREQRQADLAGDEAPQARTAREARRAAEFQVMEGVDRIIVLSAQEQELLAGLLPGRMVDLMPIMRELSEPANGPEGRQGAAFVGGFAHAPNRDAVQWFAGEVWPLVRARLPSATFRIAGSGIDPAVSALVGGGIEVVGHVPDLARFLGGCRLTVAPLRFGAGVKGKVLSSLCHGVPCIATSLAVEGMGLEAGDGVLVADDPAALAEAVCRVMGDDQAWLQLSQRGMARMRELYSVEAFERRLARLVDACLAMPA